MGKCDSEGNYSFRSRAISWSEIMIKKQQKLMEWNLQGPLIINSIGKWQIQSLNINMKTQWSSQPLYALCFYIILFQIMCICCSTGLDHGRCVIRMLPCVSKQFKFPIRWANISLIIFIYHLTTFIASGSQVPKTTLQLASNPTPAGWNHPCGQQYLQPSQEPPPQQRDKQYKIRQHERGHQSQFSGSWSKQTKIK